MIKPINNYVQIEPLVHEDFIQSDKTTYDEVGIVIATPWEGTVVTTTLQTIKKGDKVYFDSWTAAKFPDDKGGFYWLVPYANIKAYEQVS